jgi:hypothetical protein
LSFYFLKIKSKKQLRLLKYARNTELVGTFTSREHKQGEPTKKGGKGATLTLLVKNCSKSLVQ